MCKTRFGELNGEEGNVPKSYVVPYVKSIMPPITNEMPILNEVDVTGLVSKNNVFHNEMTVDVSNVIDEASISDEMKIAAEVGIDNRENEAIETTTSKVPAILSEESSSNHFTYIYTASDVVVSNEIHIVEESTTTVSSDGNIDIIMAASETALVNMENVSNTMNDTTLSNEVYLISLLIFIKIIKSTQFLAFPSIIRRKLRVMLYIYILLFSHFRQLAVQATSKTPTIPTPIKKKVNFLTTTCTSIFEMYSEQEYSRGGTFDTAMATDEWYVARR